MIFLKRYVKYYTERGKTKYREHVIIINKIMCYFKDSDRWFDYYKFTFGNITYLFDSKYINYEPYLVIRMPKYRIEINLSNEETRQVFDIIFTQKFNFKNRKC